MERSTNNLKKTIFLVVIPCDYARADAEFFETRQEAEDFVAQEEDKFREYATIREVEILFK